MNGYLFSLTYSNWCRSVGWVSIDTYMARALYTTHL